MTGILSHLLSVSEDGSNCTFCTEIFKVCSNWQRTCHNQIVCRSAICGPKVGARGLEPHGPSADVCCGHAVSGLATRSSLGPFIIPLTFRQLSLTTYRNYCAPNPSELLSPEASTTNRLRRLCAHHPCGQFLLGWSSSRPALQQNDWPKSCQYRSVCDLGTFFFSLSLSLSLSRSSSTTNMQIDVKLIQQLCCERVGGCLALRAI